MTSRTAVVLTGVGLDGGPDIISALRADPVLGARVVGVDASSEQPSRHLCDAFHRVPLRTEPGYVEAVAAVAAQEGASVIYPLPTFDQEVFAEARDALRARGLHVPVSPPDAVRDSNDKWLLHRRLIAEMPEVLPARRLVSSVDELAEAARGLGYPYERVCVRRRVSRGAIGFRVLDESAARAEALLTANPGAPGSLLVSLREVCDVLSQADPFPGEFLVEEYLPGEEWDVDVLCRDGTALVIAPRLNLAMTGGGAVRSVLRSEPALADICRRIVALLGLHAVVNISFRRDRAGDFKLIEINPRIPSSILCALGGGVNLVGLAVRQELGETIAPAEPEPGGEFLRYARSVVTGPSGEAVIK